MRAIGECSSGTKTDHDLGSTTLLARWNSNRLVSDLSAGLQVPSRQLSMFGEGIHCDDLLNVGQNHGHVAMRQLNTDTPSCGFDNVPSADKVATLSVEKNAAVGT